MTALFGELFSYTFIVRALAAGTLIAFCSALLGVSLVLKRYSMIGDGLSHVGFGAFAVALALNASPLAVAIPIVVAAAFLLLRISSNAKIKGDAAVALISSSALAIGVIIVSSSVGINTDIYNYMFGSILAVSGNDVIISVICSVAVIILYILFYNRIFAVTFDEDFAKATGVRTGVYNSLIAVLTAVIVVVGMRLMGALLISSLIVFPALTSMRLCKSFKSVTICGVIVSIVCFIIGIVISFTKGVPAGAGVVVVNLAAFVIFTLIGIIKNSTAK
ncbi:MAG: metal ABC transporter permease [Firmicutes bacterium]|nr:metal ABC transporter permease [Bacillota bacterium]MBR2593886.1 metal ABC transporter permease [Bacillota bacterium]